MQNTNGTKSGHALELVYGKDGAITIPAPREGGLVLFRGENESLKSRSLAVLDKALHAEADGITQHRNADGEPEISHFSGFDAQLRIGQLTTRKGVLSAIGVDGLNITDAIDARIVDPIAADRVRINIFCELLGVKPDLALFAELLGGEEKLKATAAADTKVSTTLPQMAERLKRDLDRLALANEKEAEKLDAIVTAARLNVGERNLEGDWSEEILADALAEALRAKHTLEGRISQATQARAAFDAANAAFDRLNAKDIRTESELQGEIDSAREHENACTLALGTAVEAVGSAELAKGATIREHDAIIAAAQKAKADAVLAADQTIAGAKAAALTAQTAQTNAANATRLATERLAAAQKHLQDVAVAEAACNKAALEQHATRAIPTDADLEAAQAAVDGASAKKNEGAVIRELRKQVREADLAQEKAEEIRKISRRQRDDGQGVWRVVGAAVAPILPEGLSISDGRMKKRDGANEWFFSELSMGARTDLVVRAAAAALDRKATRFSKLTGLPKPIGVLTLDQQYMESLDLPHQQQLHALARECRVIIYSALCDEGDLRAVEFEPAPTCVEESSIRGATELEVEFVRQGYERLRLERESGTNGNGAHAEPAS